MSFISEQERQECYTHVLLITTGSVASIKAPLIVSELLSYEKVKVEVVATKPSLTFLSVKDIEKAGSRVWTDEDEWNVGVILKLISREPLTEVRCRLVFVQDW